MAREYNFMKIRQRIWIFVLNMKDIFKMKESLYLHLRVCRKHNIPKKDF